MRRRDVLAHLGLVGVCSSLAGCSTALSGENTETETQTTSTPHPKYAECPEGTTREDAEGPPLQVQENSDEDFTYDGGNGDPPTKFIREKCIETYSDEFEDEVNERVGEPVDLLLFGEPTVLAAFLIFDFRTDDGGLREVPPIGYDEYREVAPGTLTAEVTINGDRHDCEVPVEVGCWELRW